MQLDVDSQHIHLQKLTADFEAKERQIRESFEDRVRNSAPVLAY